MDYSFIILMGCAIFALSNTIPVYGAWKLAEKLASEPFLRIGLTIFLWLIVTGGSFAVTGAMKILSLHSALLTAAAGGVLLLVLAKKLPDAATADKPLSITNSYSDRVFKIFFSILSALLLYKASYIIGTDSLLYHLYYPAMWITHGKIFAISLQGLPHEYFPVCGEVLYGWLMLTGAETPFYTLLQLCALLMALTTLGGLWRQYRLPDLFIKSSMLLLLCTGIVLDNSCLGYTDSLTGSLLLTGTAFFLLSRHDLATAPSCRDLVFAVLAGIALGMCSAVKYSGLILAPLITLMLPLLFTQKFFRNGGIKKCFLRYVLTASTAILTAGAFYLPNFIKTGNPFYPVKIPFLFSNGIDFERPPVAFKQLWSFFVNDSQWSMNTAMAMLYIALYLAGIFLLMLKSAKKHPQTHLTGMSLRLALIFLIAETVMLAIYPAMTQARSIIPFLMVSSLLFAPILTVALPDCISSKKAEMIYMTILLITAGFTGSCNYFIAYKIIAVIVITGALLAGLITKQLAVRSIMIFFVALGVATLLWCCYFRWAVADSLNRKLYGNTVANAVNTIHNEYKSNDYRPVKIASSGSWFNYLLMHDMPGNIVEYVPINKAATTHPHEVSEVSDLRTPVSSSEWIKRLKDGKFDWLLIDLESHQDFPVNRDQELQWAMAHPETFELRVHSSHIYLFKIKY